MDSVFGWDHLCYVHNSQSVMAAYTSGQVIIIIAHLIMPSLECPSKQVSQPGEFNGEHKQKENPELPTLA